MHPQHETSAGAAPGWQVWGFGLPSSLCGCSSPVVECAVPVFSAGSARHYLSGFLLWFDNAEQGVEADWAHFLTCGILLFDPLSFPPMPLRGLIRGKVPAFPSHSASAQPVKPRYDPKCMTDYFIFIVGTGTLEMSWVSCNICISHSLGCFPNGTLGA